MPHITSNNKRRRLKHYSKINNNSCKCQEKIKSNYVFVNQEKKIKKEEPQINMEDIVIEVLV